MAAFLYKWLLFSLVFLPAGTHEKYAASVNGRFHPFYVSVTEINHNASAKTLEISCKLFSEDIEEILERNYKTTLDITVEKDQANFDRLLPDYFGKHLALVVDGKAVKMNYVGFETEGENAWCYFEVEQVASPKKIEITNSILHDLTSDQINILHVTVNGKRQSTKLDYPQKQASLNF